MSGPDRGARLGSQPIPQAAGDPAPPDQQLPLPGAALVVVSVGAAQAGTGRVVPDGQERRNGAALIPPGRPPGQEGIRLQSVGHLVQDQRPVAGGEEDGRLRAAAGKAGGRRGHSLQPPGQASRQAVGRPAPAQACPVGRPACPACRGPRGAPDLDAQPQPAPGVGAGSPGLGNHPGPPDGLLHRDLPAGPGNGPGQLSLQQAQIARRGLQRGIAGRFRCRGSPRTVTFRGSFVRRRDPELGQAGGRGLIQIPVGSREANLPVVPDPQRRSAPVAPEGRLLPAIPPGEGDPLHLLLEEIAPRAWAGPAQRGAENRRGGLIDLLPADHFYPDSLGPILSRLARPGRQGSLRSGFPAPMDGCPPGSILVFPAAATCPEPSNGR